MDADKNISAPARCRVAIWTKHPGDILGEAIDFVTHGCAQHAGFIRGNGMIHELYLPKVRDRAILDGERPFLKTFDIEGLTDEKSAVMEKNFDACLAAGYNYSVEDLFRILLNVPRPPDGAMVCSQYVFWHLTMAHLPPLARCTGDFISPRDLWISPKLIEPAAPVAIVTRCGNCQEDEVIDGQCQNCGATIASGGTAS